MVYLLSIWFGNPNLLFLEGQKKCLLYVYRPPKVRHFSCYTLNFQSSYRFRLDEAGIPIASRYFVTVRREISIPCSFSKSTNF